MKNIRSSTRMSLSIGIGCATLVWTAASLGLIPDPVVGQGKSRLEVTKSLALNVATYAENRKQVRLDRILERSVDSDPNIRSIGVKRVIGRNYVMSFGPHEGNWEPDLKNDTAKQISVQILANNRPWGNLEIVFAPYRSSGSAFGLPFPFGLIIFVFSASSLFAWTVLARSLKYLDPSNVVPNRVRSALDTLAEGLVLLDGNGEIAHANESFQTISGSADDVLGRKLDEFGWQIEDAHTTVMAWKKCLELRTRVSRQILSLQLADATRKQFAVSATPILNGETAIRGVLVSFDDVTELENKNAELAKIIGSLRNSRDEVARQNERLNFLASYDPLTQCMNRRAFFAEFEQYWADKDCPLLNLMILDVDHFKNINDTHGHSIGDEVLKLMGQLLRNAVGDRGVVCRYGGEEFVILIPGVTADECEAFGNDLRMLIEQSETSGVRFTASFGLSCKKFIPMDAQHLLDQADESLYLAKRSGRNKIVRFDQRVEYQELIEKADAEYAEQAKEIPYTAVTGLLSALSFRCASTAEHSIRVADMCVVVGSKMMSRRELYRLEVAALLHDIGKIGVPDSILHKPGALSSEEWEVMRKHDDIGAEIVRSALSSEKIAHYIESHHISFDSNDAVNEKATVELLPLAARIITVCDAFDAMTYDRVYRAAMPIEDALAELERNAGGQFDPNVVKVLADHVRSGVQNPVPSVNPAVFSSQQATAIGQHIEEIYQAIGDEDVEKLKAVVQQLRVDASGDTQVNDVASRLDDAIVKSAGDDLEEVLKLAEEVMQVCRSSRNTFVDAAESITGK